MNKGHELAMSLRIAYWSVHRQADACLQPLGVTANQFVLLSILDDEDGITQQDLVRRASSDPNTVRAMLVALEGKGLVEREPHPEDGRAWRVTLSRSGRQTYKRLWRESEAFRERLLGVLHPGEAEVFLNLLKRVAGTMEGGKRVSPASTAWR